MTAARAGGLSAARRRLWHDLGLGPRWQLRSASPATGEEMSPVPANQPRTVPADEAATRGPQGAGQADLDPTALDWEPLREAVSACRRCGLCDSRQQAVFGVGERGAHWMVVGEAPGAEEDARGEPFVGQAGRLLDQMLAAVGLSRSGSGAQGAYIANVLKCRPPGNRNPEPAEVSACAPWLRRQVVLLAPRRILVMGRFAAQALLATDASIGSLRGRVHQVQLDGRRIPVVVTYHPAYLLRTPADKAKAWADLCLAMGRADDEAARAAPMGS